MQDGKAQLWLKDNQRITLKGIPYGTTYTVEEVNTPARFVATVSGDTSGKLTTQPVTVAFTNKAEYTDIQITKRWEDVSNQDGLRLLATDYARFISLKAGDEVVTGYTPEITAAGNTYTVKYMNLPAKNGGETIAYKVVEDLIGINTLIKQLTGIENVYSADKTEAASGATITNTHTPVLTKVEITKVWNDNGNNDNYRLTADQYKAKIHLYADGVAVTGVEAVVTDNGDDTYTVKYENLSKFKAGSEIKYTVKEDAIEHYTADKAEVENGGTVTNTHQPDVTEIEITKAWNDNGNNDGKRPNAAEYASSVHLMVGEDEVTISAPMTKTVIDNNDDTYTVKFANLPKFSEKAVVTYTVTEDTITGYTADKTVVSYGETITNTHTDETVQTKVTKIWVDSANQKSDRPGEITLNLYANNVKYAEFKVGKTYTGEESTNPQYKATFTVKDVDTWELMVENLPKYNDGVEQTYTWLEDIPTGYTISAFNVDTSGNATITNTYDAERFCLAVLKVWDDNNDAAGKRPSKIIATLHATVDGETIDVKTLKKVDGTAFEAEYNLDESNNWSTMVMGLPKYLEEKEIVYSWTENDFENSGMYEQGQGTDNTGHITQLFNRYIEEPEKKEITPDAGTGELGAVNPGDLITYEISYKNAKFVAADVVIKDTLDPNVEFISASDEDEYVLGTNEAGQTIVTWTFSKVPANTKGKVTLSVKVLESAKTSEGGAGKVVNGGPSTTVKIGNDVERDVEVVENPVPEKPHKVETAPYDEKRGEVPGAVKVGDEITYEISYKNYKSKAATVTIKDTLDKNVEFVSASNVGNYVVGDNEDGQKVVTWTLENIEAGDSGTVTLTVKVLPSAQVSNSGTGKVVNGGESTTVRIDNDKEYSVEVVENPVPEEPHKIETDPYNERKGEEPGAVKVGDEITYQISYKNYQTDVATVIIKDTLDKNVAFVSASEEDKYEQSTNEAGQTVITWTLEGVEAGQPGTVTLKVRVLESALVSNEGPGKVVNGGDSTTVKIGNDKEFTVETVENPVPEKPEKEEITPYEGIGELGPVNVGDEITYRITYRNYKSDTANVTIKDTLDANVEYVSASDAGVYDEVNHVVNWTIRNVPAGVTGSVLLKVKVLEGAQISNGGKGKVVNGGDTTTVRVGNDIE